MYNKESPIP